jgi:hypothetical protein
LGELDAKRPERARTLTEYRSSFLFASFFRLRTEKLYLDTTMTKSCWLSQKIPVSQKFTAC